MREFFLLLRAMLTQDIDVIQYKAKAGASRITRVLIPILAGGAIMFAVGSIAAGLIEQLSPLGLSFVALTLTIILATALTFVEAIYKSQSILFDCSDNNLVLPLPVKRRHVFAARLSKLVIFQFVYNLFFLLPVMAVYAFYEHPGVNFYLISILALVLIPLIPTSLGTLIGYLIKSFSTRFRAKRLFQTIFTIVAMTLLLIVSFKFSDFLNTIIANATSVNDVLTGIYYPAGAYISLIGEFNILEFLKYLAVNILPFVAIILLGSWRYFKILAKSSETATVHKKSGSEVTVPAAHSPYYALISKEINRYFSSSVYIMNTFISVAMLVLATVVLFVGGPGAINNITSSGVESPIPVEDLTVALPVIYLQLIVFISCMTSITSSSISIEGKSFNLTKSLPITSTRLLKSKIFASCLIICPLMTLCAICFCIRFEVDLLMSAIIILSTIIVPCFSAIMGLFFNLKFPKLNASSDAEVVKQSTSSMLAVFVGMAVAAVALGPTIFGAITGAPLFAASLQLLAFLILDIILELALRRYGRRRLREITA